MSDLRMSAAPASSAFARRTDATGDPSTLPNTAFSASVANGNDSTSVDPAAASVSATRRRMRWERVRPRPGGATGSTDGMRW